jgi:hypothetical protein
MDSWRVTDLREEEASSLQHDYPVLCGHDLELLWDDLQRSVFDNAVFDRFSMCGAARLVWFRNMIGRADVLDEIPGPNLPKAVVGVDLSISVDYEPKCAINPVNDLVIWIQNAERFAESHREYASAAKALRPALRDAIKYQILYFDKLAPLLQSWNGIDARLGDPPIPDRTGFLELKDLSQQGSCG